MAPDFKAAIKSAAFWVTPQTGRTKRHLLALPVERPRPLVTSRPCRGIRLRDVRNGLDQLPTHLGVVTDIAPVSKQITGDPLDHVSSPQAAVAPGVYQRVPKFIRHLILLPRIVAHGADKNAPRGRRPRSPSRRTPNTPKTKLIEVTRKADRPDLASSPQRSPRMSTKLRMRRTAHSHDGNL